MTEALKRDKVATFVGTIPEKIIHYLSIIYPEVTQPALIAVAIREKNSSVRKECRRLKEKGQLENPFFGYYKLSDEYLKRSGTSSFEDATLFKKLPRYLLRQLPKELQFLQLGYPVEAHGFHISAYGHYKRMVFEEQFKSGRIKFDCYEDHCEIKFGCRADPLDVIELSILFDCILEKLAAVFKTKDHTLIVKQIDIHQDRHDLSYKGKRVTFEVIKQTFLLAAYEVSRINHPLVQQDTYLRTESRLSLPLFSPNEILESMAKTSIGIHTLLSQKLLNYTMDATLRQINYERFTYLSDLKESAEDIAAAASRIDINSEEKTAAIFRVEDEQREIKDIAASINRWAGVTAEAVTRSADKTAELQEQILEDHDLLQLQISNVQKENQVQQKDLLETLRDIDSKNTYEHEEVFTRLQYQEGLLSEILQKEIPELGLYLLEFLAESPGGLTFDEILSKFRRNNIPISRGRISQLASELKKHIHTDKIHTGKRGRPRHKLKLNAGE